MQHSLHSLCLRVVEGPGTVKTLGRLGGMVWFCVRRSGCHCGVLGGLSGWRCYGFCSCMPLRVLVQLLKSSDGASNHNFLV